MDKMNSSRKTAEPQSLMNHVQTETSSMSYQIGEQKVEVMTGQSFLLLKSQKFINQLSVIKNHLDSNLNPIGQMIREFSRAFID